METPTDRIFQKPINHYEVQKFIELNNDYSFYSFLRLNPFHLNFHLNKPIYTKYEIPKKKGGERRIQAPNYDLKKTQKKLNQYLQAVYLLFKPNMVHGFVRRPYKSEINYNIVSNATAHVGKKYLLNMDIENFFESISTNRIRETLIHEPFCFKYEVATIIALLCSYERKLPTGSPCSPVLANMTCYKLDKALERFCSENQITYTRYADDLSFSSDNYFSKDSILALQQIIKLNNFKLNEKKIRLQSSKSKQTVTGLVVNKKVNVDRKYLKRLRAILHHWKKNGINKAVIKHFKINLSEEFYGAKFINKIKGQIDFVGQVRGKTDLMYQAMKYQFKENLGVSK